VSAEPHHGRPLKPEHHQTEEPAFGYPASQQPPPPFEGDPWDCADAILNRIVVPRFPDRSFSVMDYGADATNTRDSWEAFKKAVAACKAAGGGSVLVPPGTYQLHGPIQFEDNMCLRNEGTISFFAGEQSNYAPEVLVRYQGIECYNYSPPLYARGRRNIGIAGKGVFDAQNNWQNWFGQKSEIDRILHDMVRRHWPVERRVFGDTLALKMRPSFLQFLDCDAVLIEDAQFRNSPMWTVHLTYCRNITIRGIRVETGGHNTDRINLDSCSQALIERCSGKGGDDAVCVKSGRDADGVRVNRPAFDIVIRNNEFQSDGVHSAYTVGSEVSGGVYNVFFRDNVQTGSGLSLRYKSTKARGGYIDRVYVKGLRATGPIDIYSEPVNYKLPYNPTWYGELSFDDMHITSQRQSRFTGGIRSVLIRNSVFDKLSGEFRQDPFLRGGVVHWQTENVTIEFDK
jgi:polygalacturonase